ncbi:SURF1 family protein [Chromatiaceae bacterium AAb-1]|nr:SURF1 family protein [Chromatiaceae bacterium AAb-1]
MQFKAFNQTFTVNIVWCVITVAAMLILIKLAWWQLQRAQEKEQQLSQLAVLQAEGAIGWSQLRQLAPADADGIPVKDHGYWLEPYIWLLDNQIVAGRVGYDVIIPVQFRQDEPALLVNLGWIAAADSRSELPQPEIPSQISVDGLLRSRLGNFRLGQNMEHRQGWPVRLQQIETAEIAALLPVALYPAMVYQQQETRFKPHYQPVVLPPEKHRAYALQWFLLAVAVVGVALAASVRQGKHHE